MFLEVITRTYKRPKALAKNWESLCSLDSDDWAQLRLPDHIGIGVAAANARLADVAPMLEGDYIWVLDDDDICTRPTLIDDLKHIVAAANPGVIVGRVDHGPLGILPGGDYWQSRPAHGHIGCCAMFVRRDVFIKHASAWASGVYHADFVFADTLWTAGESFAWFPALVARILRRSVGEAE